MRRGGEEGNIDNYPLKDESDTTLLTHLTVQLAGGEERLELGSSSTGGSIVTVTDLGS